MQLSKYNHDDVAFGALRQTSWPIFGYALASGLKTWPEILLEIKHDAQFTGLTHSLNDPMQSGFAVWFHESVGGIKPAVPGCKLIALEPHGYQQLVWAKMEYDSPFGPIQSDWRSEGGPFEWQISIPANITATVSVPAQSKQNVTEGGKLAKNSPGVKFQCLLNGRAIYGVQSGSYHF